MILVSLMSSSFELVLAHKDPICVLTIHMMAKAMPAAGMNQSEQIIRSNPSFSLQYSTVSPTSNRGEGDGVGRAMIVFVI
jgi:hypothetical protein